MEEKPVETEICIESSTGNHLDAKAKAARDMGLSYGKYVAWQRGLLRVKGFDDNGKTT